MGAIQSFSSILPILGNTINAAQSVVGVVNSVHDLGSEKRSNELALKQLQEKQNLSAAQLAQQTALEREKIALNAAQDGADRQAALRRAVARQRAAYGASGLVSGTGGSSDAVLLGLFEESDEELAQREQFDNIRNASLSLDVAQNNSLNLLQATQLAERQNITRLL